MDTYGITLFVNSMLLNNNYYCNNVSLSSGQNKKLIYFKFIGKYGK